MSIAQSPWSIVPSRSSIPQSALFRWLVAGLAVGLVAGSAQAQNVAAGMGPGFAGGQPSFALSATPATANPVYPGTYIAYGDSITYGAGASTTANRYASLIAADLSAVLTDRGVGGTQACDTAQTILANDDPPASLAPLQTIMIGTNDSYIKGPGAYEAVYESCHTASLAWLAIPSTQKIAAQSCTQTGSWAPDTTYQPGLAAISYSPGSTLSCPVTSYGGPLYLWYRVTDSNLGTFTYSVDGGPPQAVNSFSNPPIATWGGGVDGVFVVRIPGLAAGAHTVAVTVTSPAVAATATPPAVSILAVGSLNPVAQFGAPEVFVGGVIRNQYDANSASTAAYNADAAADVALLSGDGLPAYFVPTRNFVNADTDMYDGLHPNDSGHLHLRDAFESLSNFPLNSPASFSSIVSVIPSGGFNSGVTLAPFGWPAGVTGSFGTNPATSSSTVAISVAPNVVPGPYMLTVNGTSGTLSASTAIPITLTAPPSFTLSATAASATAGSPGTSTVTVIAANGFDSVVEFSAANWPAGITATFGANPAAASSTITITVAASVAPGLYTLTLNGTLGTLSAATTIALTVTAPQGLGSSAIFTGPDASTQGTWSPTYGADGYLIANGANNSPAYASVAFNGTSTFSWSNSTSDVRALQSSPGSADRIASCYCSIARDFNFSVNLTDGATHQVAIYLLDWDTTTRLQTVTITDSASGILLDSRTFSQFSNGVYGVWNIKGSVTIDVVADGAGSAVVSGIFFAPAGASAPPSISNVLVSSITGASATITWTTDQASSSQVNLGTTTGYGSSSTLNPGPVTSHTVTLTGLTPGTTYDFDVVSTNAATSQSTTSPNSTFSTLAASAPPPYVGYVAAWDLNNSGVTVSWSTDVPATTQLDYGATPSLGQLSPLQTAPTVSHGVVLTGLNSGTTYYFVAQSTGANGVTGYSTPFSFTTTGTAVMPPPVISYVGFWGVTSSGVTISWSTNEPANTAVVYGTTNALGQMSPVQTALTISHGVTLTGLTSGTTYYFAAQSADSGGNTGYSTIYSFTTLAGPPTISNITTSPGANNTATIHWTTSVPTYSYVQVGTSAGSYDYYSAITALTSTPNCALGYVPSGTVHYQLVSTDANGNHVTSPDMTFVEP